MEKDTLKIQLLEAIIKCDDVETLNELKEILLKTSEVGEPGQKYVSEVDPVPEVYYRKLEEEFEKYKKGEIKGVLWEDLRKEIKSKYGF